MRPPGTFSSGSTKRARASRASPGLSPWTRRCVSAGSTASASAPMTLSYTIRFTPRKSTSTWSAINIKRARLLIEQGRMHPDGLKAFEARRANRSGVYSYEQRPKRLIEPYASMLAGNEAARRFFEGQAPSYGRAATWWVISARKEETRLKRARTLVDLSARGRLIPQFIRTPAKGRLAGPSHE